MDYNLFSNVAMYIADGLAAASVVLGGYYLIKEIKKANALSELNHALDYVEEYAQASKDELPIKENKLEIEARR